MLVTLIRHPDVHIHICFYPGTLQVVILVICPG